MANTSYYAKKKEEQDRKMLEALEARRNRGASGSGNPAYDSFAAKKKANDSKLQVALDARTQRIQSSLTDIFAYIQKRLTEEYDYYSNTKPAYGAYDDTYKSQRERRISISDLRKKVNAYRNYMEDGVADSILSSLEQMEKGYDAHLGMAKFESEDAYNKAVEQAEADAKRWNDLTGGYDPSKNKQEGKNGWADYVATQERIAQNKSETEKEKPWYEKLFGYMGDIGPDTSLPFSVDTNEIAQGYKDQEAEKMRPDDRWTDEQREIFGYLWNTERQKAWEYAFAVNNMLNVQAEKEKIEGIQSNATDNFWAGAGNTIGAIASAPLGLADYLGDLIAYGAVGYVPQADGEITPFEYSQAVTGGISEHLNKYGTLDENIPVVGGKGWGDVYGLGTSIAQSSAAALTGGSAQALITFFGSAAASGVDDAVSRGATGEQALLYGTAVGAAEALAEMIGVDNLMRIGSSSTFRQLLVNLLKQGGAEGLEEGITNFLGNVADNVIMGDKSSFYLRVNEYMNKGLSEEEAKSKAWVKMWEDMAYDTLGGFVSGVAHAGPQTAYNTYMSNAMPGSSIMNAEGGVDALKNLANEVAGVSDTNMRNEITSQSGNVTGEVATGNGLGKVAAAVKNASNAAKVGKLYNTVQTANNQANATANQADIAKSLQRKGFNAETANDIATALVAENNGQPLTKAQEKLLASAKKSKVVQEAISNIITNDKSTMGQRSQNIRDFQNEVKTGLISRAYGVSKDAIKEMEKGNLTTDEKKVSEGSYEVSAEGKTIDSKGNDIVITGVESIKDGKMVLKTESGTIDSSEVQYASEADALVYEAVAKMGASPASAWTMIKSFKESDGVSAQAYATAAPLAYMYGKLNYKNGVFVNGKPRLALTEAQSATAFQMGRDDAAAAVKATAQANTESTLSDKNTDKKIIFEGFTYNKKQANDVQKASMEAIDMINKMSSLEVHVFKSYKKNGKLYAVVNGQERVAPNGYFTDGNKIYIDINAGNMGEGIMLYTMSHEIGHYIARYDAQDFKAISDFLFEHYGENVPIYELLEAQKKKLKKSYEADGKQIPSEAQLEKEAHEELVCDMLSRMLADKYAYEKLMEFKQKDLNAFQKLGQAIKKALDKIAKALGIYDSLNPDFLYAASVENFGEEAFRQLQDLYIKAFVQADANYQAEAQKNTTEDGGVKYEIREIGNTGKIYVQADRQVLTGDDASLWGKQIESYINEQIRKEQDIAIPTSDGHVLLLTSRSAYKLKDNHVASIQKKVEAVLSDDAYALKGRAATHIDELIQVARFKGYDPDLNQKHENDIGEDGFNYFEAYFRDLDGKYYLVRFSAALNAQEETVYSIGQIRQRSFPADAGSSSKKEALKNGRKASGGIIYTSEAKSQELKTAVQIAYEKALKKKSEDAGVSDTYQAADQVGMEINADTESVAPKVMNSERTWTESDYVQEREQAAKEISKAIGVSVKKAKAYIDSVNSIAKMIAEDRVRLDYFSSPGRSSFVGNVEYGGSFDFSTLCKKRRLLTGTFTAIQKALPNTALTADEILDIRNRMKDAGLEVSCGLCYVEGSRANMGQFAKEFLRLYKQYNPDAWQPNMADVNTPDGIEWVRINHPECYEQYEYFWNHYGTLKDGDKNLFASQQKPKLYQLHTEYKGEILDKFNNDDNVEEKNLNGGIRLQSFSDFEIVHLIDTMQIIMDMSRVGLAGQAYTKVPDFAWALGDTGLKINLSLIAKGVDANGKLIFDDVEGMPIDKAVELRNRYSKNVGTILVAFNDEQLLAAMADERVDYIIPFHRSQWKKSQYGAMGLPAKTKDYTYMQNEKFIKPQYHEYRGRMVQDKATNYMPNEYWDFSKSGKENAEAYLEMCARSTKRPKFYKLLQNNGDGSYSLKADGSTDGYWKLLIDFKMYDNDGNGSPQMPVKPEFNMDEAQRMLNDYQGGHSNFPVAQSVVDSFVEEYKESHKGVQYSDRDSDGNQITEDQVEYFENSQVRNRNGNLQVVYHGGTVEFEFDTTRGGKGATQYGPGAYFTDSKYYAKEYTWYRGGDVKDYYLNIEKMFDDTYMDATVQMPQWKKLEQILRSNGIDDKFINKFKENGFAYMSRYLALKAEGGAKTSSSWEGSEQLNAMLREAGFDGIKGYLNDVYQYIIFTPNQAKLTTNEVPSSFYDTRYSDRDYVAYDRTAILKEETVDRWLMDYASKAQPNYAQMYIAYIDPTRFLDLTTSDSGRYYIEKESKKLDEAEFADYTKDQPIFLGIDHKTGEVTGHEGRHRCVALRDAGITSVPVLLMDYSNKYDKQAMDSLMLTGQVFTNSRSYASAPVFDILPLNYANREEVIKRFATKSSMQRVGEKLGLRQTLKFQDRDTESVSNRSLLANAFEGVAQNDIEKQKIQEYKSKIDLINSEEQKLGELNEKIKELSFAKGPRDTKAIRDLQFEAKQTANRISTYDKQLLRLEASKPLQDVLTREKKMAYKRAEQKGKEALAAYRERATKTQRELLEKWQDSRKKGIDSRHRTAMRHKIKDVVNELNQYLLRGTKDRHVPIELQKAVAEALDAVNMDTVGAEERIAKLKDELLKAKTPEQIQEISRKIDHIQEMGEKMNSRLQKLKDAYDQFVNSDDPLIANSHDEVISNKLQSVIEDIGNTPLRDMTLSQLEDVYDMYRMVLTTIRNANKAFKAAKSESISTIANRVMEEVEKVGGKKKLTMKGMDGIKSFFWNNLKPVYAFEHIGSDAFTEVFSNVRSGEDVWAVDVTEAREFYLDKSKKYGYDSWDFKKLHKFTSTSGLDFDLSIDQIMSLYAYSKRDQAAEHLSKGGIVIDETTEITIRNKLGIPVKFNPTEATAYNISAETLADIVSKLSEDQKKFVDDMQEYLSTVMGAKGNEVSLVMYGVKLFKEKFYFPLKSATQFMAKAKEQQKGEVKIKNSGFSKETVQKASNPIVLTPFMNVWADHVNEMSMYHAFVLPLEDFYRVYNYKTPTSETMATESVEMFIQNAYGKGATKYIDQLLKDLNGGARTDTTTGFINKMMGLFKKGAVFASLSVVVQQPSAIARAAALVDTKYFIGPKVDHKRHKALWGEVKQYAPVAIIKEMGYFDTNMGKSTQDFILGKEYSGFSEKMKALVADSNYRDEVLSKAPALADEIAWCGIWEAVKRETKAKNPGMDVKSEAFLKMCGERFTEVIVKTQVYDSVLSRSGMMRSKDTGMKMATAFMAEPTTSINMIADALLQGKRGNRKYARAAIGAVIASQILNSILVSFVYAGRDDDEDETYLEKYVGTLSGEILDSLNPAGYIPFIKDVMSIVQGYDVERSDMAVIADLWNAWQNLSKDNMSAYRKVEGFAGSIAQLFGLPVKNIMRDARGIYQTITSFVNGQETTAAGIEYAVKSTLPKWLGGGDVSNQNQLYEAYLSGDKTQIARVEARFENQVAINSAIRKALRENDSRIHDAAVARINGNLVEYTRLAKEIIAEGHFSQDNVVAAINAEINAINKGETTTVSTPKASGLYTADDFAVAITQGNAAMANAIKVDIIQTAQKNGKTPEEAEDYFVSSATTALKGMFLSGDISEDKAIDALETYCGKSEDGAMADVRYWAFKRDYPDVYVDDQWFDTYYEKIAYSGLDIVVYMEYRNTVSTITGEGKKDRRLAVINSLPITIAQKDALYFAEGWAESNLYEAPWH